jgi:F-type H+-transporting ATPase subunit alpha
MQYLAPYAGASVAEWFRQHGGHSVVVYDDLTKHADAYRELALLLDRPPGREAFPGDIFYVHAELLERATALREESGGGSVTAFPIVETTDSDISGYIPTNLISITDGQIYLSPRLVRKNQFPAVDLGVSVSRVGGKAQSSAFRSVAGNLRVSLSQFEELEDFARFGTRLDDTTRARLTRGAAVRASLRQAERDPIPAVEQLAVLVAAMDGQFDGLSEADTFAVMAILRAAAARDLGEIAEQIAQNKPFEDNARAWMAALGKQARATLGDQNGTDT